MARYYRYSPVPPNQAHALHALFEFADAKHVPAHLDGHQNAVSFDCHENQFLAKKQNRLAQHGKLARRALPDWRLHSNR